MKRGILSLLAIAVIGVATADEKQQIFLEELSRQAGFVAKSTGQTHALVFQQLKMEDAIRERHLGSRLREEFKDRLTGISVEHAMGSSLVVRLKGDAPVEDRILDMDGARLVIKFLTEYSHTLQELKEAQNKNHRMLRSAFPNFNGSYVDETTGEIVLNLYSQKNDAADSIVAKKAAQEILGVPVRIKISNARFMRHSIKGGAGINIGCTTGFAVQNKMNFSRGILSAAHCDGHYVTYYDPDGSSAILITQGESNNATDDVKWYRPYGFGFFVGLVEPKFYSAMSSYPTTVTGKITQSETQINNVVCHRGITSGYTCGKVVSTQHKVPDDDSGLGACGPSYSPVSCAETWIHVEPFMGGNLAPDLACASGDSGGPWFSGTKAAGIHTGGYMLQEDGECLSAIYMSIDRINSLGVELLYGP